MRYGLFSLIPLLSVPWAGTAQEGSGTRPTEGSGTRVRVCYLVVRCPAAASLMIQGVTTRSTGPVRWFVSPALVPGRSYTYTLKATWQEGGRAVTRERTVPVRAGQEVAVNFGPTPPPGSVPRP